MRIYIAYTYSFYGSTVVSVKATDTFGSLLGRSQKSSAVRLQKYHIELQNQAEISRSAFGLYLICKTCNEIHSYMYEYISTYRPTFFLNSTRESKDQIDMALVLKLEEAASLKIKGSLYSCLLISCLPSGSRMFDIWKPSIPLIKQ